MKERIKNMLRYLKRYKVLIIVAVVVTALIGSLGRYVISVNRLSMVLSLSYSGIDEGLNPDGSRFNISELKSDAVLQSAIKKANIQGITVDYLRNRVDIESHGSVKIAENVKAANAAGSNYSYIPNEYTISYSQKAKLSKNHTYTMLKALSEAYTEYFKKNYTENSSILKIDNLKQIDDYEYVEIAELYTDKISQMIRYLQVHKDENPTYVSTKTNQTFGNLIEELTNLRDVDVDKYKTYVIKSSLMKNKENYLQKLQYSITEEERDYQKSMQASDFISSVVLRYDPSITGVLYIPSVDKNRQFYMNRTQTGLDYLTKDAHSKGTDAKKIKEGIDHKKYLYNTFLNANPTPEETSAGTATAKKMLSSIETKIENISQLAQKTDNEYLEYKTSDYLKFSLPKTQLSSYLRPQTIVKYGILGFLLALAYIVLVYFIKKLKAVMMSSPWVKERLARYTKIVKKGE